jgi:hypothetical protein
VRRARTALILAVLVAGALAAFLLKPDDPELTAVPMRVASSTSDASVPPEAPAPPVTAVAADASVSTEQVASDAEEENEVLKHRAENEAACEIVDGLPPRAEAGDVVVDILGASAIQGTLTVDYVITASNAVVHHRGEPIGSLAKTAPISHQRVTLLRCLDRSAGLELELDDGFIARAEHVPSQSRVTLEVSRVAILNGRLLADGKPLEGAELFVMGDRETGGAGTSDGEGRFVLKLLTFKPGTFGTLVVRHDAWRLVEYPAAFRYGPGSSIDLGDLKLVRKPPVNPGLVGIGFEDREGEATIRSVIKTAPAEQAGLQKDDVVIEVDGVAVRSKEEAMSRIPGDAGTHVRLKVRRGSEFLLFDVTRQTE